MARRRPGDFRFATQGFCAGPGPNVGFSRVTNDAKAAWGREEEDDSCQGKTNLRCR
jgi:hypothetical protein